jgi:hypothetical protein
MDEFGEAYERAAAQGKTFARVAETFDRLEKSAARLKEIFAPLFLGIAKYIAEPLDQAITKLNSLDLGPIGEKIGSWIGLLLEAFGSGQLGQVLQLSIQVALEKATFYSQKFGLTLAAIIVEALKVAIPTGYKLGKDAIANIGAKAADAVDKKEIERRKENAEYYRSGKGVAKYMQPDVREGYARKEEDRANEVEMGMNDRRAGMQQRQKETLAELNTELGPSIQAAIQNVKDVYAGTGDAPKTEAGNSLDALIASFTAKWEAKNPIPNADKPGTAPDADAGTAPEEFTAAGPKSDNIFARMGFITNGAASTDYSRKTADNTDRISNHTERMAETMDLLTSQNFHALA